ncbi:hypothetical protein EBL87_17465 [Cereibacter sphaeroides]|uniref:hypothetical protein n=1 Tax=Cereibacter sphaeroides TaxID=1063 RepID=UPI000F51B1F9|nr:hypothetical protein [Cereibacter sphaeroides]AZB65530.1 hypothetical protein EBL87_17465 [Cereibacter sphaeroides]AZB70282.1 hypothetical protein EBL86_17975 [Cereibacter sphaeroides]
MAELLRQIAYEIEAAPVKVVGLSVNVSHRGGQGEVSGIEISVSSDGRGSARGMSISVSSDDAAKVAAVRRDQAAALRKAADYVAEGKDWSFASLVLASAVQTVTELGLTDLYQRAKEMLG